MSTRFIIALLAMSMSFTVLAQEVPNVDAMTEEADKAKGEMDKIDKELAKAKAKAEKEAAKANKDKAAAEKEAAKAKAAAEKEAAKAKAAAEKEAAKAKAAAEKEAQDAQNAAAKEAQDAKTAAEKDAKDAQNAAAKESKDKEADASKAGKEAKEKAMAESSAKVEKAEAAANNLPPIKFKKSKKAGMKALETEDYDQAAQHFMDAFKAKPGLKPKQYYMGYEAGKAYYKLRDYKKAQELFQTVSARDSIKQKYPQTNYMYSLMDKHLGKYAESITGFDKYAKMQVSPKNVEAIQLKRAARKEKEGSENALAMADDESELRVELVKGSVNSPNNEYAAYYMNDNTMLFTAHENDENYNAPSKVLMTTYYNGQWTDATDVALPDNDGKLRIENGYYHEETNELFFTKCKRIEGRNICNIFVSKYEGGNWQDVKSVGNTINSLDFSSKDPMLGMDPDGNTVLYFVSNAPRSRGGYDIWYAKRKEDGSFDRIRNLGFPFNTAGNEVSPFWDAKNSTLYFSSNGHPNCGGLDVLYSTYTEEDGWSDIANMGFPVNSSADDYYFSLDKNSRNGFLASNRAGGAALACETCTDDIYMVRMAELKIAVEGQVFYLFDGREEVVEVSEVKLMNKETNEVVSSMQREDSQAFFFKLEEGMNYELISTVQNFGDISREISTMDMVDDDTISIKMIHDEIKDWKGYMIGVVYFDYNARNLRDDSPEILDQVIQFLNDHEDLVMEVGGHTDSKGTDTYNQRLSERRAKAVKVFLTKEGVPSKRIITMGYGESKPMVPNENPDGSDNEENRAQNRRVEFIVVGSMEE